MPAEDYDRNSITRYLDSLIKNGKGIIAGVINEKANGYEYMFISDTVKLREYAGKINEALDGRGGGKDNVIQGSIRGDRKTIEEKVREVFGRNDYE